jgi:hypothetical protein
VLRQSELTVFHSSVVLGTHLGVGERDSLSIRCPEESDISEMAFLQGIFITAQCRQLISTRHNQTQYLSINHNLLFSSPKPLNFFISAFFNAM